MSPIKKLLQNLSPRKTMEFSPVPDDDDELSQYIKGDQAGKDNSWDLNDGIDPNKLDAFWTDAVKELGPLETDRADKS